MKFEQSSDPFGWREWNKVVGNAKLWTKWKVKINLRITKKLKESVRRVQKMRVRLFYDEVCKVND